MVKNIYSIVESILTHILEICIDLLISFILLIYTILRHLYSIFIKYETFNISNIELSIPSKYKNDIEDELNSIITFSKLCDYTINIRQKSDQYPKKITIYIDSPQKELLLEITLKYFSNKKVDKLKLTTWSETIISRSSKKSIGILVYIKRLIS